jgi:hypothetical protein
MTRRGEVQPFAEPAQVTKALCDGIRELLTNGEPPRRVVRRLTRIVAVIAGDLKFRAARRARVEARKRRHSAVYKAAQRFAATQPPGAQGEARTATPTAGSPASMTQTATGETHPARPLDGTDADHGIFVSWGRPGQIQTGRQTGVFDTCETPFLHI